MKQHAGLFDLNKSKKYLRMTYDIYDDRHANADVNIYVFQHLRISLRIRRNMTARHFNDITVRCYCNGKPTEADKIRDGLGDYMLYCWTHDGRQIDEYVLIDLDKMQAHSERLIKDRRINNTDGDTAFSTYDLDRILNDECCVAYRLAS